MEIPEQIAQILEDFLNHEHFCYSWTIPGATWGFSGSLCFMLLVSLAELWFGSYSVPPWRSPSSVLRCSLLLSKMFSVLCCSLLLSVMFFHGLKRRLGCHQRQCHSRWSFTFNDLLRLIATQVLGTLELGSTWLLVSSYTACGPICADSD